ncbi:hypothetical protein ACHAWF_017655 [Thalassiosira exigua]
MLSIALHSSRRLAAAGGAARVAVRFSAIMTPNAKTTARLPSDYANNPMQYQLLKFLFQTNLYNFQQQRCQCNMLPNMQAPSEVSKLVTPSRPNIGVTVQHRVFTTPSGLPRKGSSKSVADEDSRISADRSLNKCISHISDTPVLNQRATGAILEQLSSPPNILTLSRIVATPYLSYLVVSNHGSSSSLYPAVVDATDATLSVSAPGNVAVEATTTAAAEVLSGATAGTPTVALALFLGMGFTDFLDGYIARRYPSTATVLGTYLDPFADKLLISVMSLTLWHIGVLPGMLVGLWVTRDVGIVGSVYWLVRRDTIRTRKKETEPSESDNYHIAVMDPQNTPLKVQASFMSKVNTTLQIFLIALGIAGEVPFVEIPPELMTSVIWITAGTTIGSSLGYLDGSALMKSGNK